MLYFLVENIGVLTLCFLNWAMIWLSCLSLSMEWSEKEKFHLDSTCWILWNICHGAEITMNHDHSFLTRPSDSEKKMIGVEW
jgi:hypothetical protein